MRSRSMIRASVAVSTIAAMCSLGARAAVQQWTNSLFRLIGIALLTAIPGLRGAEAQVTEPVVLTGAALAGRQVHTFPPVNRLNWSQGNCSVENSFDQTRFVDHSFGAWIGPPTGSIAIHPDGTAEARIGGTGDISGASLPLFCGFTLNNFGAQGFFVFFQRGPRTVFPGVPRIQPVLSASGGVLSYEGTDTASLETSTVACPFGTAVTVHWTTRTRAFGRYRLTGTPSGELTITQSVEERFVHTSAASRPCDFVRTYELSYRISTAALTVTPDSLPTATVGLVYGPHDICVEGGSAPYLWSVLTSTPGLGFEAPSDQSNCVTIGGTPTEPSSSGNKWTVSIAVEDSELKVGLKTYTLAVSPSPYPPLSITSGSLPSGTVGIPYSGQICATGGVPPYTWSSALSVPGLSVASTGECLEVSGTPTAPTNTQSPATVSDSVGQTASTTIALTVVGAAPTTGEEFLEQARRNAANQNDDIEVAQLALAYIVSARTEPGQSTNETLRDAEYALRNWIGGRALTGNAPGLDNEDFYNYLVVGNPVATGGYNAYKWLLNGVGRGSWARADPENPNSEPGGWDAAVDGWFKGLRGTSPELLFSGAAPSPGETDGTLDTPFMPVPKLLNYDGGVDVFVAPVNGERTFYFDPPAAEGYAYDVGVGPSIRKVTLPAGRRPITLVFGQHRVEVGAGLEFDFTPLQPSGVRTFQLLTRVGGNKDAHLIIGLQFMTSGTVAVSQERVPTLRVRVVAQGSSVPGQLGAEAAFETDVQGPDDVSGSFSYRYLNDDITSSSISHVAFIGLATVIRGTAHVNGTGGYTFVATIATGTPGSIGIQVRAPDGSIYLETPQKSLTSGVVSLTEIPIRGGKR